MAFELNLFTAIGEKMRWHEARQALLAENIANAETPGYRGRDLTPYTFAGALGAGGAKPLPTATTEGGHIAASTAEAGGFGAARQSHGFEITPEGNAINLEDEMMKVTTNQMDFQAAAALYTRSMKLIRTALGR